MNLESVDAVVTNLDEQVTVGEKPCEEVPSKPTRERIYSTTHLSIGTAIVLNQVEFDEWYLDKRDGSIKDVLALAKALTTLDFKFSSYDNLTVKGIKTLIEKAAQGDFTNSSCLMIFVLTHGDSKGILHAKDGTFSVEDLYKPFLKNASLHGKPKFFFLQASRGSFTNASVIAKITGENLVIDSIDSNVSYEGCYTIPTYADILIMYSTVGGVVSIKNATGSWFIQKLCEELTENPHDDLLSILTYVNNRVAYDKQFFSPERPEYVLSKQMPVVKHTLTKKLFLKKSGSDDKVADKTKADNKDKCNTCRGLKTEIPVLENQFNLSS